jgi:LysM repeat protein
VTISDATAGTTIYYTTNGTTPTTSSSVYSSAITVSATETLKAIAVETGYTNSTVGSAAYTITLVLPAPTFSPVAGSFSSSQSVTISDSTAGTTIYYTTNGTTPTTSSTVYSGPITVSATETLEAIAVKTGYTNSAVATAVYTIVPTLPAATFSPAAGTYTTAQSVTISDATAAATIYYTTNGTTPTTSSTVYSGPITVSATETLVALAVEAGYTNSAVATAAYTIAPALPAPTFSPAAGTYATSQSVTISDATAGATIYYTTNGTTRLRPRLPYTSAITVSAKETLEAIAVKTGYTNSAVATAVYTIAPTLPTPTFSPAAGTYTTSQSVTISDATAGTTIYYTTNGTTPTTSSTKYTARSR